MVKTTVSLTGLELYFQQVKYSFRRELVKAINQLTDEAERYARDLITVMIYDTPKRGYERTGMLRESILATSRQLSAEEWEVKVYARGGAGGRDYASYNELGTYEGRRTFDEILTDADENTATLITLEYGRPSRGLEPRPWTIPTAVHTARAAPPLILQAVRKAAER